MMWLLIFSIQTVISIVVPDNSVIHEIDLGTDMYVYSREYDEIIYESDTSDIKLCHNILNVSYGRFLKGMGAKNIKIFKRNIIKSSNKYGVYDKISDTKKYTTTDNINTPHTTSIDDGIDTLSARCPTYLSYIKCIYSNYIQPLSSYSHPKKYTNDFLKYIDQGLKSEPRSTFVKNKGGDLSFHLRQVLFQFCQFIRYGCPKLLESFAIINELQGHEWYMNFPCSAFDYITPICNFNDLYDKSIEGVNDIVIKDFIKLEIDEYIKFQYRSDFIKTYQRGQIDENLLFTSIGTLYDVPINKKTNLNKFFFTYCVDLCTYLTQLANFKKYYSKEGLARFYFICSYRELDCNVICGVCN